MKSVSAFIRAAVLMDISILVSDFFVWLLIDCFFRSPWFVHPSLIEHNGILDPTVKDVWSTTVLKSNLIVTKCYLFLYSIISP